MITAVESKKRPPKPRRAIDSAAGDASRWSRYSMVSDTTEAVRRSFANSIPRSIPPSIFPLAQKGATTAINTPKARRAERIKSFQRQRVRYISSRNSGTTTTAKTLISAASIRRGSTSRERRLSASIAPSRKTVMTRSLCALATASNQINGFARKAYAPDQRLFSSSWYMKIIRPATTTSMKLKAL